MNKATLVLMLIVAFAGCNQNPKKAACNADQTAALAVLPADSNVVYVYNFRGKARCKACVAVNDVARQTVENSFADNPNVRFVEINTNEKGYEALIEKYEITWNALIIAKGENAVEITRKAFLTAVENPQLLENLIKDEINKRLTD